MKVCEGARGLEGTIVSERRRKFVGSSTLTDGPGKRRGG